MVTVPRLLSVAESAFPVMRAHKCFSESSYVIFNFDYRRDPGRSTYAQLLFGMDDEWMKNFRSLLILSKLKSVRFVLIAQLLMVITNRWKSVLDGHAHTSVVSRYALRRRELPGENTLWRHRVLLPVLVTMLLDPDTYDSFFARRTDWAGMDRCHFSLLVYSTKAGLVVSTPLNRIVIPADRLLNLKCVYTRRQTATYYESFGNAVLRHLFNDHEQEITGPAALSFTTDTALFALFLERESPNLWFQSFGDLVRIYVEMRKPSKEDPTVCIGRSCQPEWALKWIPSTVLDYIEELGPLSLELENNTIKQTRPFNWEEE